MKTKDRILLVARQMFNQYGYANVSLNTLSSELGIAKGNLWYHFNNKRDLLNGISEQYLEHDKLRQQIETSAGTSLQSYVLFLKQIAKNMREFRFLFRDQADYGEHSKVILDHLPSVYDESQAQLVSFLKQMKQEKHLDMDESCFPNIAINIILVVRYGLDLQREWHPEQTHIKGAITKVLLHHLSLIQGSLSQSAYDYLHKEIQTS